MKKTVVAILLTITLLFSFAIFTHGENTLKANASNNISNEVSEKLKAHTDYENAIRIYTVGMYFHDLVNGKTLDEIINTFPEASEMYFTETGASENKEYGVYTYANGEIKASNESDISNQSKYIWLKEAVSAKILSLDDAEDKPITNVYCLRTASPPRISVIIYQTLDATYYAVYNNGTNEAPCYMSEDAFMAYVNAYVAEYNSHPNYDEEGNPLYWMGSVNVDPLNFGTLNISLKSQASVDDSNVASANDNVEHQEGKDNFVIIIVAVSAIVCIAVIAVIVVFVLKKKELLNKQ